MMATHFEICPPVDDEQRFRLDKGPNYRLGWSRKISPQARA